MKVWKIKADMGDYQTLITKEEVGLKLMIDLLSANIQNGKYDYLELKTVDGDGASESDFILFWNVSGVLITNLRTKLILKDMVRDAVEFIPVKLEDTILYILNVIKVIDAVDYEKTILRRQSNGLVVGMEKYSFNEILIKEESIFKVFLKDKVCIETYVTEKFRTIVEENHLTGIEFEEVWDSEE